MTQAKGVVALTLMALAIAGCSQSTAQPAAHQTIVKRFNPFSKGGAIAKGYQVIAQRRPLRGICWPAGASEQLRPGYLFECPERQGNLENCTTGPPHEVACPLSLTLRRIVLFRTRDVEKSPPQQSWMPIELVLRDGRRCMGFTGTTFGYPVSATYDCGDVDLSLLGMPNISHQPWTMKEARFSPHSHNQLKDVRTVRISEAWFAARPHPRLLAPGHY